MDKLGMIRGWPEKANFRRELLFTLAAAAFGLLLGYIAKAADSVSIIGDIGTELGVWVFIVTMIAAFSLRPLFAAINAPAFLLSMLLSYYLYGQLILGFFPKAYFMGWLVIALISPIGGFVVWFSRGKGIIANICAALPVSVLLACGYPAVYTHNPVYIIELVFAVVMLLVLPKTWKGRAVTTGVAAVFAIIIVQSRLISFLPW